ncbi:MAG TPA: HlyD family efflux transporter periplasmic adaptor subunit [Nocardioidaceae bacterium]|nr:HlyD family efflux transporter periplasmic adaptor subunit [Nocardioidaceae bacterium]
MTFLNRVKYLFGMLLVLGLVGILLLHLNTQIGTVHGDTATLKTRSYSVGTDYPGVLVREYVEVGDRVEEGQPMYVVKSQQLNRDISNGVVNPRTSPYEIRNKNEMVVRANAPGKVVEVGYIEGSLTPVNAVLAEVEADDTTQVEADFLLTPEEYVLIRKADEVRVTLPSQRQVDATITDVSVQTDGDRAQTRVQAVAPELTNEGLFTSGTPLEVEVQLRDNGLLHSAEQAIRGLFTPSGQR